MHLYEKTDCIIETCAWWDAYHIPGEVSSSHNNVKVFINDHNDVQYLLIVFGNSLPLCQALLLKRLHFNIRPSIVLVQNPKMRQFYCLKFGLSAKHNDIVVVVSLLQIPKIGNLRCKYRCLMEPFRQYARIWNLLWNRSGRPERAGISGFQQSILNTPSNKM